MASLLHPPTQGLAGPNGPMWGIQETQDHASPRNQLHAVIGSPLLNRHMLHASSCRAAGVRGRITSRQHLVSTLVSSEIMFVQGQEVRLRMRVLGRWPAAASITIRQRQSQGDLRKCTRSRFSNSSNDKGLELRRGGGRRAERAAALALSQTPCNLVFSTTTFYR